MPELNYLESDRCKKLSHFLENNLVNTLIINNTVNTIPLEY